MKGERHSPEVIIAKLREAVPDPSELYDIGAWDAYYNTEFCYHNSSR